MSANVATVKQFVKVNYNKSYHIHNKDQLPDPFLVALTKLTALNLTTVRFEAGTVTVLTLQTRKHRVVE